MTEYVEQLSEEFGDEPFTSHEACEVLGIEWMEFMERFVNLNQNSGDVQKVGRRGDESVYEVTIE